MGSSEGAKESICRLTSMIPVSICSKQVRRRNIIRDGWTALIIGNNCNVYLLNPGQSHHSAKFLTQLNGYEIN